MGIPRVLEKLSLKSELVSPVAARLAASVIIVNYNSWLDLRRCLNSLKQTGIDGIEVIVIDNASTDDSPQRILDNFPWVRLFCSDSNIGFGGANNLGALHAKGDILVFLNPDTLVTSGWLGGLIQAIEKDTKSLVSPRILFIDYSPPTIYTCGNHVSFSGLTFCLGWGIDANQFVVPESVPAISGTCFAINREFFVDIGGFDAIFFLYVEDTDLSWKARLAGGNCRVAPDSVIYHNYELRFSPMKAYFIERNRWLMLLKNLKITTLILLIPLLFFSEFITWGYLFLKGPQYIKQKLRSYWWLLSNRELIIRSRCQAQRLRKINDLSILKSFKRQLLFTQTVHPNHANLLNKIINPVFYVLCGIPLMLGDTD